MSVSTTPSTAAPSPRGSVPPLDASQRRFGSPSSIVSQDSRPTTPLSIQLDDYGPMLEREKDFCTNFSCCGLTLPDMHALLDHFEESHVVVIGADGRPVYPAPPSPSPASSSLSNTALSSPSSPYSRYLPHLAGYSSSRAPVASIVIDYPKPYPPSEYQMATSPFADVLDSGLGLDFGFPDIADPYDPFGFEAQNALAPAIEVGPPSPVSPASPTLSTAPSIFDSLTASTASSPVTSAFSSPSPKLGEAACLPPLPFSPKPSEPTCVPPAMLENPQPRADGTAASPSQSVSPEPCSIPLSLSRRQPYYRAETAPSPSPTPTAFRPYYSPAPSPSSSRPSRAGQVKAELLDQPAHSIKISGRRKDRDREKQYRCPNASCTKRYLNPNGLKYHVEKGTCTDKGPRPYVRKAGAAGHSPVAAA
ncbi:uncharacterized protein PHACADRAFT_253197 [Phanerochaete carnosa HHB-10118-sp]|uniref:C2H2-type domain-containing protein n=1 Tax=Phanerochaete carnosa (strain HHB-10118-sp) TaxID=650164 RepID=K5W477_PHACS|nr:uncharacterized protein PHACADRAFT_253197 [Phanerochaete carnosa HHB-10118-sp]EKM58708.1 hypothetical protein PHACADRAFT_253197 [Phanerochaete carnosa HHB-10118-sp]